jgi:PIN domain nuclease of toxin-antitoxin system
LENVRQGILELIKILLDTHDLIWSFINPEKLPQWAADLLVSEDSEVFFSQASLWEISIKFNSGKLVLKGMTPEELYEEIEIVSLSIPPIQISTSLV